MKILVLGEHNENEIQQATLCVVDAAKNLVVKLI